MQYRFARDGADYSDFASGAVLHSTPGRPAFPVRLASELFQRAYTLWAGEAEPRPCVLYDPCCGTGYLLTVVTLLHGQVIGYVVGSDVDRTALELAFRNLGLLTPQGMRERLEALSENVRRFGKDSHRGAVESAERLLHRVEQRSVEGSTPIRLFQADVLDPAQVAAGLGGTPVDIVLTDTPYGTATSWIAADPTDGDSVIARMLASLRPAMAPRSIVVTVQPRGVRPKALGYRRVQRFRSGHREALFWRLEEDAIDPAGLP